MDDITSSLSGLINSLDTTIMFTTAGTLELGDAEAGAYNQVSDYSKVVIMNITNFLKSVKMLQVLTKYPGRQDIVVRLRQGQDFHQ